MELENISAHVNNYKCFGEARAGFDRILPINLIIGRNNSGKSTLIDLVEYLASPTKVDIGARGHKGGTPRVSISSRLTKEVLASVFQANASFGGVDGNHWEFAQQFEGCPITWEIKQDSVFEFLSSEPKLNDANLQLYQKRLASAMGNPFAGLQFWRLSSDRDIRPESDLGTRSIESDGTGATNAIRNYLNKSALPRELVRHILNDLNKIYGPDGRFTEIIVREHDVSKDAKWEVYLVEDHKGYIPLSQTGSGLKTILLVLIFIHLAPPMDKVASLSKCLFGFEELENNLHPALQRRLLSYLREIAIGHQCKFFLTTHSSVAIDLFAHDDQAQIIHLKHDGQCASAKLVTTYVENKGILDDLDVRASDLLQSNAVVWLEGPSDRLYFNRWIEIWSDGKLQEGAHYQCVFYGGRLLAHLSSTDPDVDPNDVVKILRVNRNAIVLIDSDRKVETASLNTTKQRVIAEVETIGGLVWVTSGMEVENYLPLQALCSRYNEGLPTLNAFEEFSEYLKRIDAAEGKRFLRNKVLFAERMLTHITRFGMESTLDLTDMVSKACERIYKWNGMTNAD